MLRVWQKIDALIREAGTELIVIFLLYSFALITSISSVIGVYYAVDEFIVAQQRLQLYLLSWTLVPLISLLILLLSQTIIRDPFKRRMLFLYSSYYILFGVATHHWFGATAAYLWLMIVFSSIYWLMVIVVAIVPQRMVSWCITAISLILFTSIWVVSQQPIIIEDTYNDATVLIRSEQTIQLLPQWNPARISWSMDGIETVALNDESTIGVRSILRHNVDRVYQWDVQFPDKTQRSYTLHFRLPSNDLFIAWSFMAISLVVIPLAFAAGQQSFAVPLSIFALTLTGLFFINLPWWIPPRTIRFLPIGMFVVYGLQQINKLSAPRWLVWVGYAAGVLLAIGFFVDVNYPIDAYHSTVQYVGSATETLAGRIPAVDHVAHYGILQSYIAAGWFRLALLPPSLYSFAVLLLILMALQHTILFVVARRLGVSHIYSWTMIGVVIIVSNYLTWLTPLRLPSSGAIRYLLQYIIILAVTIRVQANGKSPRWFIVEYAAIALVFLSEPPMLLLTIPSYLGVSIFEAIVTASGFAQGVRLVVARVTTVVAIGLSVAVAYVGFAYFKSGQLPTRAFYIASYVDNFATESLLRAFPTFYPWIFTTGIIFVTLSYLLFYGVSRRTSPRLSIPLFIICVFAVGQNIYWIQERWDYGIGGVQNISLPAVLYAYWMHQIQSHSSRIVKLFSYVPLGLLFVAIVYTMNASRSNMLRPPPKPLASAVIESIVDQDKSLAETTHLHWLTQPSNVLDTVWYVTPDVIGDAVHLIEKYSPDETHVAVFFEQSTTYEVLLRSGRSHIYPVGHPLHWQLAMFFEEAIAIERQVKFINTYSSEIQAGDYIYVHWDGFGDEIIWNDIIAYLETQYEFDWVEVSPHNVAVIQMLEDND